MGTKTLNQAPPWVEWPHPGPEARRAQLTQQGHQQQQTMRPQTPQQSTQPQASTASIQSPPQQNPIDPTKNVLDLVAAESRYRDEMREADIKFQEAMLKKEHAYQTAMREAEIRRQDDLSKMKATNDEATADTLRHAVASNAKLVSEQMDRVTGIMGDRIAKLEQFRYESSGKGSGMASLGSYVIAGVSMIIAVATLLIKSGIRP